MAEPKSNKVLIIVIVAVVLALPLLGCLVVFLGGGASWFMLRSAPPRPVSEPSPIEVDSPNVASMRYALERWQVDQGLETCPTLEDLESHRLLMPDQRNDEFHRNPWEISCEGGRITATSRGPDGAAGTADDVAVTAGN